MEARYAQKYTGILMLLVIFFSVGQSWLPLLNGRIRPVDYMIASWMNLSIATTKHLWQVSNSSSSCIASPP